jgi:hypothetical protein
MTQTHPRRPEPTLVIDVVPSARGFMYQLKDGSHSNIKPGTELTYVGDPMRIPNEERVLEVGRTYVYAGKVVDHVRLDDCETGERKRLLRETFEHLVRGRNFHID